MSDNYTPPADEKEALARREALIGEIKAIETQLGGNNKTDATGRRMSAFEWDDWRARAKGAIRHKHDELAKIKAWLRANGGGDNRSDAMLELAAAIRELTAVIAKAKGDKQ